MKPHVTRLVALAALAFIVAIVIAADHDALPAWILWFYSWPGGDKLGHFVLMGGLSYAVNRAIGRARGGKGLVAAHALLAPGTLAVAVSVALEEWSQMAFRSRSASVLDLAASLAGVAVGALLAARGPATVAGAQKRKR